MIQFILFLTFLYQTHSATINMECGEGEEDKVFCSYDTSTKTLTVTGKGEMSSYKPWTRFIDQAVKVVITGDIPVICSNAFSKFSELELVEIGENVTTIDIYAFSNCRKLSSVRTIGKTKLETIGAEAFVNCDKLALFSSTRVSVIKDGAFSGCRLLPAFFFNYVKSIGNNAFRNTGIKYVDFGASLESFGNDVFYGCSNLYSIQLVETNPKFWSEDGVFFGIKDGVSQILVYPPAKDSDTFTIPDTVELIPNDVFLSVEKLVTIDIGNGVKRIKSYAFQSMPVLNYVKIGTGLKILDEVPFYGCGNIKQYIVDECNPYYFDENGVVYSKFINNEALVLYPPSKIDTTFTIPTNIKKIGTSAFSQQHYIEELTIGNNVMQLQQYSFSGMTRLKKVTITAPIKSIGTHVFYGCSNLVEVTFGKNVKMIGKYMFHECGKLQTVSFEKDSTLLSIEAYAFSNSNLTEITIPDTVRYVMDYVFSDCLSLTSVVIGKSIKQITTGLFMNCHHLHTITFNTENLIRIDEHSFDNCLTLTTINIPTTVQIISDNAFYYCISLTNITFKGTKQPTYCSRKAFPNSLFAAVTDMEATGICVQPGKDKTEKIIIFLDDNIYFKVSDKIITDLKITVPEYLKPFDDIVCHALKCESPDKIMKKTGIAVREFVYT